MTERLQDRHALLTGAGGGIGLAVARAYLAEGARCTLVDLRREVPEAVQALIAAHPGRVFYVGTDIAQTTQIDAMIAAARGAFGTIEVLFNNAAVFDLAPLLASDEAMYERLFAVNVKGMFFVMQKVLAQMVEAGASIRGRGTVINLASQAGRRGEALVAHYCATKAAVISYTQSAALAMAPHGIRVNAIAPGYFRTAMTEGFFEAEGWEERMRSRIPQGRFGELSDLVGASIFLASDASGYVTGHCLAVDGGVLASL